MDLIISSLEKALQQHHIQLLEHKQLIPNPLVILFYTTSTYTRYDGIFNLQTKTD